MENGPTQMIYDFLLVSKSNHMSVSHAFIAIMVAFKFFPISYQWARSSDTPLAPLLLTHVIFLINQLTYTLDPRQGSYQEES